MIKFTKIFKRPHTGVKFASDHLPTDGDVGLAREQTRKLYNNSKTRLGFYSSLSEDKLTLTTLAFWDSKEAYDAFKFQNAELLAKNNQIINAYNEANGIVVETKLETV